jgi:hypothetical protein
MAWEQAVNLSTPALLLVETEREATETVESVNPAVTVQKLIQETPKN